METEDRQMEIRRRRSAKVFWLCYWFWVRAQQDTQGQSEHTRSLFSRVGGGAVAMPFTVVSEGRNRWSKISRPVDVMVNPHRGHEWV